MKHKDSVVLKRIVTCVVTLAVSLSAFGADDDPMGYALLVQQSPADGGTVTPSTGIHKFSIGESVSLSAMPRPGYRFLYWLGDVSATSSSVTSVSLDSPKMVIAVFERESFEEDLVGAGSSKSSVTASSGLLSSPYPIDTPGSASIGSYIGDMTYVFPTPSTEEVSDDPILVPGGDDDSTESIVIPEPATLMLLGLGAAALLRKR